MKKSIILIFSTWLALSAFAQYPDLPGRGGNFNLQKMPAGSYIIAMDNQNQNSGGITAASFNLKAYGLLVTLLNNNIKLKWIIKPGKLKDGIDFSVNAAHVKPIAGVATNLDFRSGPFVIFQQDTAGVAAIVQSFNGAPTSDDVKLYKSIADVSVDVRYDYFINSNVWKPRACILSDGGNEFIHEAYMVNAAIPSSNYSISASPGLVFGCFTFASEPHNTTAPDAVISQISAFVHYGGNFLAQCAAVRTYELSALARFQTTNGFDNSNENKKPENIIYSNADLAYFQVNGDFGLADEGGSLQTWQIPQSPIHNFHYHTSGTANGRNYTNASVSKLITSTQLGGEVFYLGSHNYDGSNDYDINGQRMYLNAFLVPTNPQGSLQSSAVMICPTTPNAVLTINPGSVSGPAAAYPLTFTLYQDNAPVGYSPEDLQKGNTVTMTAPNTYLGGISSITTRNQQGLVNYIVAVTPGLTCFSTKYIFPACSLQQDDVRVVDTIDQKSGTIVYPNPTKSDINILFDESNVVRDIGVIDMSGRMVKLMKGVTTNNVRIENLLTGVYTIRIVVTATGEQTVEKVIVNK